MKFLDGGWLVKEGYDIKYAVHVYDVLVKENKMILYMPYSYVSHRGATLDGGLLTMEVFSPQEDIIGVKLYNYKGRMKKETQFDLNTEEIHPNMIEDEESYRIISGDLTVEITKGENLNVAFYYKDKLITQSFPRSKAYIIDPEKQAFISEQLSINVDEKIYGLGERFTNFVKNGQSVEIWNADGGTGTEQAYKNIPFYISNYGYGVFVNSPDKVSFEVGSEKVSRVQFSVPGEELEYYIIAGETLKDVLGNYTELTGKPSLPPSWSFGLWLSTSFLTDYDEKTVNSFVDGMIERDIPLEVFHFDCLWMKEYEWCNFTWDERTFPEPKKMLQRLKSKGLKICVWINPYIGQKSPLFDEGMKNGYFLKTKNGDVWQWDKWQAGMAIVDFTNPEAVTWYVSKLKTLIDMGVDCFKTDFGERIPTDAVYFNGADAEKMHNYYAYLYNEIVYNFLVEEKGKHEAVVFARSASVGSQKFPVHWGGDSTSDYPSMAESLRAGLSFGLGGFGYWSHDISGFEAGASEDIYKRWTQFGLLSSHSRYHGSWEYKVPWLYGEEAVAVTRFYTKLKLSLMPYLQAQSVLTTKTGVPMMRAMMLEFTDDIATHTLDQQYMLGENLLVAPIFNEDGIANFYVPKTKGDWVDYLTGKVYQSGQWYTEKYDYFHLPLLVRPNSIIVEGACDTKAEYEYHKDAKIHIYVCQDTFTTQSEVFDSIGNEVGKVEACYRNGKMLVKQSGFEGAKVVLHCINEQGKVEVVSEKLISEVLEISL
ncbi:alpha-D-xyloside xylohydrolase [Enterococcus sp. PF1-24]|uniref:alpha-xylosidase n=1 Tax=unclassified Enterococcus TaxID=2608891 RepID=UPI0024744CC9|nr:MULTISPECIES: alpha-xylosidase [unclassified Enterococcus]MDH6365331.1 alpha-D-xyloside xylohydrolase [Enterococcus sp. PFB1-1]MDH6402413.1 alpha-D-xyloside xylohydrolase [Enterococcus sp. PF1-24]